MTMNDVRGDAARAARNGVTSHAAPFGTRPGYRSPAKAPATGLVRGFLCEKRGGACAGGARISAPESGGDSRWVFSAYGQLFPKTRPHG